MRNGYTWIDLPTIYEAGSQPYARCSTLKSIKKKKKTEEKKMF